MSRRRGLEELERPAQVGFERVRKKRPEESRLVARGAVTAPLETRRRTDPRMHRAAFFRRARTHTETYSRSCTHGTQIASTDRHDTSMASAVGFFFHSSVLGNVGRSAPSPRPLCIGIFRDWPDWALGFRSPSLPHSRRFPRI